MHKTRFDITIYVILLLVLFLTVVRFHVKRRNKKDLSKFFYLSTLYYITCNVKEFVKEVFAMLLNFFGKILEDFLSSVSFVSDPIRV